MRIISGQSRGRKLKEPVGMDIRPTTDKVKESIFNIIQFEIEGRRVLDLFAGTGQLGIEAISRGAGETVFVDQSKDAVKLVSENLDKAGLTGLGSVVRSDSIAYLGRGGKFDVVFLDPPYDSLLADKAIEKIIEFDILKENGIIIYESKSEKTLPELSVPYFVRKTYKYGKIKITVISKTSEDTVCEG